MLLNILKKRVKPVVIYGLLLHLLVVIKPKRRAKQLDLYGLLQNVVDQLVGLTKHPVNKYLNGTQQHLNVLDQLDLLQSIRMTKQHA
jgi:hypothetical protein